MVGEAIPTASHNVTITIFGAKGIGIYNPENGQFSVTINPAGSGVDFNKSLRFYGWGVVDMKITLPSSDFNISIPMECRTIRPVNEADLDMKVGDWIQSHFNPFVDKGGLRKDSCMNKAS